MSDKPVPGYANHPLMESDGMRYVVTATGSINALSEKDRQDIACAIIEAIINNSHLSSVAEPTEGGFAKTVLKLADCKETARYGETALDVVLRHDIDERLLNSLLDRPVLIDMQKTATIIL